MRRKKKRDTQKERETKTEEKELEESCVRISKNSQEAQLENKTFKVRQSYILKMRVGQRSKRASHQEKTEDRRKINNESK